MSAHLIDANCILDRLKDVYALERDTKIARFLDLTPSAISAWRRRNTIDLNLIVERCLSVLTEKRRLVNLHWLITGVGESTFQTATSMITEELLSTRSPEESERIAKRVVEKLRGQGIALPHDAGTPSASPEPPSATKLKGRQEADRHSHHASRQQRKRK